MSCPIEYRYTKDHEWVKVDGNIATIGITNYAQDELGELVFVELPSVGLEVNKNDSVCVVESTKAASDVYTPLTGNVVEVNSKLEDSASLVNSDPYGEGWLFKIELKDASELDSLMTAEEYSDYIDNL